ncbi:hypothetical protein [Shewanella sp. SG41-3]|uniref:hypothetical protein n=1 Tax=Shewanella sp. SG41-3 TaxID=2760977 RepID=UPI001603D7E1|nr:hypothetical protein [Shewanella sp. SG41-3]MBB1475835.1 hypothetical protein [Shewanella sp. SG41-3]
MNTSNITPESHHYPPLYKIKQHANFLSKNLPVTLCQAQEMIAYYQHCNSWSELKYSVEHGLSLSTSNEGRGAGMCHFEASKMRHKLATLLDSDWDSGIEALYHSNLVKQTISHSIYNNRLDWLIDEEVRQLYERLYEDDDKLGSNLFNLISSFDNNFLNLFNNSSPKFIGQHFYDYKYGLKMYCNQREMDGHLIYIIREFDSYLYPPGHNYGDTFLYNRPWFVNYVVGYINNLLKILNKNGLKGELILHRVNNYDCITDGDVSNVTGIMQIAQRLIEQGAIMRKLFGNRDSRIGLALPFGK